jgi:hypothetical protein
MQIERIVDEQNPLISRSFAGGRNQTFWILSFSRKQCAPRISMIAWQVVRCGWARWLWALSGQEAGPTAHFPRKRVLRRGRGRGISRIVSSSYKHSLTGSARPDLLEGEDSRTMKIPSLEKVAD